MDPPELDRLQVKFIGAIGAVFDFYTGRVKTLAPRFSELSASSGSPD